VNAEMPYILEVQEFHSDGHITHPEWNGKKEHIGYMNKIFTTKQKACDYYHMHNPHMRKISATFNWKSDWDPETKLLYVIRESTGEFMKIPPFD
jgi:hypothetical protein